VCSILRFPPTRCPCADTRVRGWLRVNIEPHFGMKVESVGLVQRSNGYSKKPAMPSWMCVRVRVCENFDS